MSLKSAYRRGVLLIVVGLLAQVIAGYMLGAGSGTGWTFYTPYSVSAPNLHQQASLWHTVVGSLVFVLLTLGVGVILISFWHQLSRSRDD